MSKTPLRPIPLITPGFFGLNTANAASSALGPEWALTCQNSYFDANGRLAARKGWAQQNPSAISGTPTVQQIFEYVKGDATTQIVSAANNKLYSGTTTPTDVTGTLTITANNWQFQNWNDKVVGWQAAHTPIVWSGSGNFTVITAASGSLPTGNCVCAAFGRLWALDSDNNTIKYCGLLDETNWGAAGSGSINMRSIWTNGTDQVIGISAVGANLVVFGTKHIILFTDGRGSPLGLDPAQLYVSDTIEGTGLLSRDTVVKQGTGDLLYVSPTGLQSLARVLENKSNPILSLDLHVWDYVNSFYANENAAYVRALYSPTDKFYLLILPTSGEVFCYDTRKPITGSPYVVDGSLRVTEWIMTPACGVTRANKQVVFGFAGGFLGLYSGFTDNAAQYRYSWASPNMSNMLPQDEELENRLKIPKRLGSILFTQASNSLVFKWGYDFFGFQFTYTTNVLGGQIPEYGRAEYGSNGVYEVNDPSAVAGVNYAEYAGALVLRMTSVPMAGTGRWIQLGLDVEINGSDFAIQQLDMYIKAGVMV
jgi:hypothetical protein